METHSLQVGQLVETQGVDSWGACHTDKDEDLIVSAKYNGDKDFF